VAHAPFLSLNKQAVPSHSVPLYRLGSALTHIPHLNRANFELICSLQIGGNLEVVGMAEQATYSTDNWIIWALWRESAKTHFHARKTKSE
jgi:hypothetical protein